MIVFVESTTLIVLVLRSDTYIFPAVSTVILTGLIIDALVAAIPFPSSPDIPFPIIVEVIFVDRSMERIR